MCTDKPAVRAAEGFGKLDGSVLEGDLRPSGLQPVDRN